MRKNTTREQQLNNLRNAHGYEDNDWFFDNFDRNAKKGVAGIAGAGCLIFLFNIVVWGALIYFVVWTLNHFGAF